MSLQGKLATALDSLNALDGSNIRSIADAKAPSEFAGLSKGALDNLRAALGGDDNDGKNEAERAAVDAIRAKFGVA